MYLVVHAFNYTEFPLDPTPAFPEGWIAKRPVIEVTLFSGSERLCCSAIVDTGADFVQFPKSYLKTLKLDETTAKESHGYGVGGRAEVSVYEVTLVIPDLFDGHVSVGFTDTLEGWPLGLLGWRGFLEHFKTSFTPSENIFTLEPNPQPSSEPLPHP